MNNTPTSQQKNLVAVIGMGRSGTSAITRGLKTLGISLGDNHIISNAYNPRGFWEDKDIVLNINEKVLHKVGYTQRSVGVVNSEQLQKKSLKPIATRAAELLQDRFQNTDYWAFKDPRTCRILPFWQPIFAQLNIADSYVIALRNPLSALASSEKMSSRLDPFKKPGYKQGLLLWLSYLIPAIKETQGKKRIVVDYELMLQDPVKQLERIQQALNIPYANIAEVNEYANKFLDKKLTHHEHTYEDLSANPATPSASLSAYVWLSKLARDEISFDDAAFQKAWNEIEAEFNTLVPSYRLSNLAESQFQRLLVSPLKFIRNKLRK